MEKVLMRESLPFPMVETSVVLINESKRGLRESEVGLVTLEKRQVSGILRTKNVRQFNAWKFERMQAKDRISLVTFTLFQD